MDENSPHNSSEGSYWDTFPAPKDLRIRLRGWLGGPPRKGPGGYDLYDDVELVAPGAHGRLLCLRRDAIQPTEVPSLRRRLREALDVIRRRSPEDRGLLTAVPALATIRATQGVRDACLREGLGLLDLTGTILVHEGPFFLHIEGREPVERRSRASLFRGSAPRVLRTMLTDPSKRWKAGEISEATQLSVQHVWRVLKSLEQIGHASRRTPRTGFALTDPPSLLRAWMKSGVSPWASVEQFNLPTVEPVAFRRAERALRANHLGFSWTLAACLAPVSARTDAPEPVVFALPYGLYLVGDSGPVVEALSLRQVTPFNFMILRPTPQDATAHGGLFHPSGEVPQTQLILDFNALGGRGLEEADHLLRRWASALPLPASTAND